MKQIAYLLIGLQFQVPLALKCRLVHIMNISVFVDTCVNADEKMVAVYTDGNSKLINI